ncbi:glutamyl-tRNA reductase [Lishizhenia tianjinensis]|uniref:Glutamyl-tRNA reductase n=1 Tax=Lishizhenia tianjinensis TaxID=477690 RepID=A0A1I7B3C8_9FLAO|nr:glutamyl-tRNA reductase [Lishizhenia tianjinensis]SFT81703.1 glutamyl-tRNA reductase [Lishizhenia tianjinensis]
MERLHILAFTHRNLNVSEIGRLHIELDKQKEVLSAFKSALHLDELMFLSTCNRVEFIFTTDQLVDAAFIHNFFATLYPHLDEGVINCFSKNNEQYEALGAVNHLLSVASSIDSMIVGEREIITQVRKSFEDCKAFGLTGDTIRLVMRFTIETAKRVYTETSIATKPVSVVSLAYHTLKNKRVPLDARVVIVGAGVTNTNMSKFLRKHGFKNFTVFNRTLSKAEKLAEDLNGTALPLTELKNFKGGFDVLITCTGSDNHLISPEIYTNLVGRDEDKKIVIDIAIPHDLSPEIKKMYPVDHISVDYLQEISNKNLQERAKEVEHVEEIIQEALFNYKEAYKQRNIEIAMRQVPQKMKEIKSTALEHVFAEEMNALDDDSRETVEKILAYMEKKYISVPMKMAKEILLKS